MAINRPLHERRANEIWPLLIRRAINREKPFSYGDLGKITGIHPRVMSWPLGIIQRHCDSVGWPPLQALAVNQATKIPGHGYDGSGRTLAAHAKALAAVYDKTDWSTAPPAIWRK